jgi:uncharacterized protein (TIGR04255 family)
MAFMERTLLPRHLSQSPLLVVLAQIRFSPILQMDKFIPAIQESLRGEGFPKFQAVQSATFQFPAIPAAVQNPTAYWEFMDRDETKSIVLGTESVAFSVTEYSVFPDFQIGLQTALLTIHETVRLPLRTRIGLRYTNLVIPKEGKQVSDYVRPEILGLSQDKLALQRMGYASELLCRSEIGNFLFRCIYRMNGSVLPPDLQLLRLKTKKPRILDCEFCILDFDHSIEEEADFDLPIVSARFSELHDLLDRSFIAAVTPEALKEWE